MFAATRYIRGFGMRVRLGLGFVCTLFAEGLVQGPVFLDLVFIVIAAVALSYADVMHDVCPV